MAKLYDVRAVTGEYEKDGQTKKKYQTIGAVLETKNGGMMIKIDNIPVGWEGFAYLNEQYENKTNDVAPTDIDKTVDISSLPF